MRYEILDVSWIPRLAFALFVVAFATFLAAVPDRPFVTFVDLVIVVALLGAARERCTAPTDA